MQALLQAFNNSVIPLPWLHGNKTSALLILTTIIAFSGVKLSLEGNSVLFSQMMENSCSSVALL